MTIKQYLETCGARWRDNRPTNEEEYNRQVILGLPQDIECSYQDFIDFITILAIGKDKRYNKIEHIQEDVKNKYLIQVEWNDKPIVKELFAAWLNLDTMELSVKKPYDAFSEKDSCILIEDYRQVSTRINWIDLRT